MATLGRYNAGEECADVLIPMEDNKNQNQLNQFKNQLMLQNYTATSQTGRLARTYTYLYLFIRCIFFV